MKNLFICKKIIEDKKITSEAFSVWCVLRNIIHKEASEYFISFNMISYILFKRESTRRENTAIKNGFFELVKNRHIKILYVYSKSEYIVDLSSLYFSQGEYFSDLTYEEMVNIMNISCNLNKYKLLRYYTCMIGSFNRSLELPEKYRGKIGGMGMEYFVKLLGLSKNTIVTYNSILEENKILYIIRRKSYNPSALAADEIKEYPNIYCRWKDKELVNNFINTKLHKINTN